MFLIRRILPSAETKKENAENAENVAMVELKPSQLSNRCKFFTTEAEAKAWYKEAKISTCTTEEEKNLLHYKNISWEQILDEIKETKLDFDDAHKKDDLETSINELTLFADQLVGAIKHLIFHYTNEKAPSDASLQYQKKLEILSERAKELIRTTRMMTIKNPEIEKTIHPHLEMLTNDMIMLRDQIKQDLKTEEHNPAMRSPKHQSS